MVARCCTTGLDDRGDGKDGLRPDPCLRADRGVWPGRVRIGQPRPGMRSTSVSALNARQGVRYHLERDVRVLDPETMQPGRTDGETMGEIMFQREHHHEGLPQEPRPPPTRPLRAAGSTAATWPCSTPTATSRSGTAARTSSSRAARTSRPSRWKTCSTATPDVLAAAVVAKPDPKWGERPCAFVELKAGADHARRHRRTASRRWRLQVPRAVVFGELPKTSTGKIRSSRLRKQAGRQRPSTSEGAGSFRKRPRAVGYQNAI